MNSCGIITFKPEYFDLIALGKKTSTIRKGRKQYKANTIVVLKSGSGRELSGLITRVLYIPFRELTSTMAKNDGFDTLNALKDALMEIYKEIEDTDMMTVIEFEVKSCAKILSHRA